MTRLFDLYPGLHGRVPHLQLANLPTPLDAADRMAAELGVRRLWIKRDDLSAKPYGGNKVRKLEHLLADALEKGCDAVLTYGAAGSNHALATSIYARRVGLDCYAVLTPQAPSPKVTGDRGRAMLGRGESGYDAALRWNPVVCNDLAGYIVRWRKTTAPYWEKAIPVGNITEHTFPHVTIDESVFGVSAVDHDGNESLVSVYVMPARSKRAYQVKK